MLHFLSSLFAGSAPRTRGPDEALVRAALERLVVGTDRGLSEALVDLALLVWPIHWTRLREARF